MIIKINKPIFRGIEDQIWVQAGRYHIVRPFDDYGRLLIDLDAPSGRTLTIISIEDGLLEQEKE